MTAKRFAGLLVLVGLALALGACDEEKKVPYTFENKSSYSITVTLDSNYYTSSDSDAVESLTKQVSIYSKSSVEIFVDSTSVDFSWSSSNETQNAKIYCIVDGGTATFKDR